MGQARALFIWWFNTIIIALLGWFMWKSGVAVRIYNGDISHLTQVIALLLLVSNFWLGWITWGHMRFVNSLKGLNHENFTPRKQWSSITELMNKIDVLWYISDTFLALGILGSVIGTSYLFSNIGGLTGDVSSILQKLGSPLGTLLFTTGSGVASGIILKTQLVIFQFITGLYPQDA